MITYAQIEAIHEAMRECALEEDETAVGEVFYADDVHACFAKIRAALAGESRCAHCPSPTGGPHKMSCALNKDRAALAGESRPSTLAEIQERLGEVE